MTGWIGKIIRIDLSAMQVCIEHPEPEILYQWIGGRGIAGFYISPWIHKEWNDPDMPLCLFTGPLVGTTSPTSGRMTIMSKSPLTGTIGDSSVGGRFGTYLKRAGWDGVIITGQFNGLCGIEIENEHVRIQRVEHLTGMSTSQAFERLKDKGSVALIGPAAEKGVRFSNIIIDKHFAAGRNGLGLIFANKHIKYISVKGSGKVPIHDKKVMKKAREDIFRLVAASPILLGEHGIANYGTGALYDLMNVRRMMPTSNFHKTYFEAADSMNAWTYHQRYSPQKTGCRGCHIQCKQKIMNTALPEFETMSHFSALIDNKDTDIVVEANRLCNDLGMDTISAASTLACYQELSGTSIQSNKILTYLIDIANAKGVGKDLGMGAGRLANLYGRPECAMTVKNQELPAYDPRGSYGMALSYVLSTRGGCHLRAYPISHEILRKPVATDRFSLSGKARIIKIAEDMFAVVDSLTACKFVFFAASLEEYALLFKAVTGVETSAHDLLKIGERICFHERIMNAKNGFTAKDDDLPDRFFTHQGSDGHGIHINPIDREDFLNARNAYYQIRGLTNDGMPIKKKAEDLGLNF